MEKENLETRRWLIAIAAIIIQLCLGTVYAWSVFKKPLMTAHGWTETSTQITFMLCIGMIGMAAAFGGTILNAKGPRFVATLGGVLFAAGTLLAGFADQTASIMLLYVGFGLIGGLGNGFGYITPIATLIKWFPDKRGLVTGLAVMGFGMGAFFMGRIAPSAINSLGVAQTFLISGVLFAVLLTGSAQLLRNPPDGWLPQGFSPALCKASTEGESYTFERAVKTPQWFMLWAVLFLNISAGIGLLSQLSPMAQELFRKTITDEKALAVAGGAIVAVASIFNGLGRLVWAWISDITGRKNVFITMFITQAILYLILPQINNVTLFTIIACYLLACYGGGFATMPAFAADAFGPAHIGKIYGIMLTAWSVAGIVGPLVFSQFRDTALYIAAGLLIVGLVNTALYKHPESEKVFPAER